MVIEVEQLYSSLPCHSPEDSKIIKQLYDNWLGGQDSDKCSGVLHTQYHEIAKIPNALNIKWWKK